ncbi:uncharacterized protein PG998_003264 [Apiospora kogelbergensis]|uniref:uncharacterized protein n=1 Tax=Apiospora kogelbergensis TaxID=1337665 RepID=UPI00313076A5
MSPSLNLPNPHRHLHNHPRQFDHIESERQHLEWLLYEQGRRADGLFSRVAATDVAIDTAYDDPRSHGIDQEYRRRQAHKYRARIQRLIDKSVEREKEILSRLGEIHLESQYRERWLMVEQQKTFLRQQRGGQQWRQQQQRDWDWEYGQGQAAYADDHWNKARRQKSGTDASYHPHHLEPTNTASGSSYARRQQRQHVYSVDYLPYTTARPQAWYIDPFASTGSDQRHRRRTP